MSTWDSSLTRNSYCARLETIRANARNQAAAWFLALARIVAFIFVAVDAQDFKHVLFRVEIIRVALDIFTDHRNRVQFKHLNSEQYMLKILRVNRDKDK